MSPSIAWVTLARVSLGSPSPAWIGVSFQLVILNVALAWFIGLPPWLRFGLGRFLEQAFELGARVGGLVGDGRPTEEARQLGPCVGLAAARDAGSERRRVEGEELAEVPALLVLDHVGLGLATLVVARGIVVPALAAGVIVAPAALARGLARDRLGERHGGAAVLALVGHVEPSPAWGRLATARASIGRHRTPY